jgi:hypothetical protein
LIKPLNQEILCCLFDLRIPLPERASTRDRDSLFVESMSTSPRKVVPLATGDETRSRVESSQSSTTKRVFFCGVVVEGSEGGRPLPNGKS